MPKYLIHATYTASGAKGLLKSGGTARRKAVETLLAQLGGKLETFYFTFGDEDAILIIDLPDQVAASAVGLAVSASGSIRTRSTVLIDPEEVDKASRMKIDFHPPGE
ncbi:MAG: GYD domain-containing protein [Candidatus Baltobacteraceae bacterium]